MIKCPKCSKELEDGAKFCDGCGTQLFESIFCPNCGAQTSTEFAFCQKCGASIAEDAPVSVALTETTPDKKGMLQTMPKKALMFGGIGIIALVVIILAVSLLSGGGSSDKYGLYLKAGEIFYTDYSENDALKITSRLSNGESVSDSMLSNSAFVLSSYIAFSDNGSRIFFPDRITSGAPGITLYYRDIHKPDEDAVKIDSDVAMYAINGAGTKVAYIKGSDRILYLHDLTDKTKIASGVTSFSVADDLKKISYHTDENSYYLWYADKDTVKLANDISSIDHTSADLSVIYYTKDGSLYKQVEGSADKEKISSDVSRVLSIYDSGEIYYTKAESAEKNLLDYVEDDLAASDAVLTEPDYPDYPDYPDHPSWSNYDTEAEYAAAVEQFEAAYEAYETACEQAYADYEAACDAYYAKLDRDDLRADLRDATMERTEYTLCYFNGAEETIVTDALTDEWSVTCAQDKPVMTLQAYNQSDVQKVKLSEINATDEVRDLVHAALYSSSEQYVATGAMLSVLEQTDATYFNISSDGGTVYFLDDISDSGEGDLYKVTIADGKAGKPERYDSNVSDQFITLTADDEPIYYKNVNHDDYKGDLFISGEEIDYDVYLWSPSYLEDAVLYYTDWNNEKSYGTLKMFQDGSKTKIADDVHDFDITSDNDIRYLYDYSTNYFTGTLYLYNHGEPKKIDDDVVALIPPYPSEIMGEYFYGW